MKHVLAISLFFVSFFMIGQDSVPADKVKEAKNAYAEQWIKNLTEKGIEIKNDSLFISDDYKRAINDINYRKIVYPENYKWEYVAACIKMNNLKPAFWHLINLYSKSSKDKEMTLKFILTYDSIFLMDEVLLATFYTYSFMDPETSVIKEGKPEIIRPDILDRKLNNVNEMVSYLIQYREEQKLKENKN